MKWHLDIIRLKNLKFKNNNFSKTIFELYKSKHDRKVPYEYAPKITDCISSVRYLIEKNTNTTFPFWWIYKIPYLILEENLWDIIKIINYKKIKIFDLLFIRNKDNVIYKNYKPTHMWVYLWEWKIFQDGSHITKKIITFDELFKKYNKISLIDNYNHYAKKYRPTNS